VLIGREAEMRAIDEALSSARLGNSSCLVIRGEPGIGKTALLEYAIEQAGDGMRVLSARGVEFETGVAFAGLHELLHPALGGIERLMPIHASALRSSLGLGERIEADRLIVGAAVLDLISTIAEERPVLVVIDDAQWLDRASTEAIAFATRRMIADPVAVLVAAREGEDSPLLAAGLPELAVGGLDLSQATDLLHNEFPTELMEKLVAATGGNPLALLELARAGSPISAYSELPVVTSVERAYLRRAGGLSDGARDVLLLLAASGDGDLMKRTNPAQDDIDEAEGASGLVRTGPLGIEFVHPLARAAIYHSASAPQRRAAHRAIAGAMTGMTADQGRRAWHLAAAATGTDDEAAAALEEAGQNARESSAYDAAAEAMAEAARLSADQESRARRLLGAAENAWLAGHAERALELLRSARRLAASADIDVLEGHIAMRRGAVAEGFRTLVAAAESVDRLRAIRILSDASISAYFAGHPAQTLRAATRALGMLREEDPPEVGACAYVSYGLLAILAGHGSDGPEKLRASMRLFERIQSFAADPLLLESASLAGLFLREAKAGRELLERALRHAREQAPTAALPSLLFLLGRDAAATDRWPLAHALYEEASRMARETTQSTRLAGILAGLAWLEALEGNEEQARTHAAEAGALAEQFGMSFFKAWSLIALGLLEMGLGHPEDALRRFRECAALLREIEIDDPDLSPVPEIVDALVRLGREKEAPMLLPDFEQAAAAKGQPFALARAARARALIAGSDFPAHYEEALRHHRATPDVFEQARTQLYFGERLRRSRRKVDARKQLREALQVFDRLGAAPWAERALAELKVSGETARVRDDRYRRQLTPQELQVALTLAEGATTREAAARLYLSPKTVEYHLRHVYDKLEIRTREELRLVLASASE
jgi:DNA-binding CsgD family transcriptional regulator